MRSLIANLSTDNLLHNLNVIKKQANNAKIIAMVKANSYGHGLRSISLRLQNNVDFLGVAAIDEALQLRKAGVTIPLVLMSGIFEPEELLIAAQENFAIVLHNEEQISFFDSCKSKLNNTITTWLKIDTGMGRLGFNFQDAVSIYKKLINNNIIKPLGLMSHLACADNKDHQLNQIQINNFNNFIKQTNHQGITSLYNSAGIFNFKDYSYDVVRPGMALYGVSPIINKSASDLNLKPVMTLKTNIIAIKRLPQGSTIGYGAEFVCPRDLKVAVIAVGYGDGYPRITKPGMPVLIHNKECNIIGRVSMDMAVINLDNCQEAQLNDEVVLWGNGLPIEKIVKHTNNSVYDLLAGIQNRVRFNWTMGTSCALAKQKLP